MSSGPALVFGLNIVPLTKRRMVVGRGDKHGSSQPDLDLEPLDGEHVVSRQHAEIEHQSGITVIQDLGSRNGTFVNDQRLEARDPRHLLDGDSVRFGHIAFAFASAAEWPADAEVTDDGATFVASSLMVRALKGITVPEAASTGSWREQIERIQEVLTGVMVTMVFQPIIDLQTGLVNGVESLARLTAEPRRTPDLWFIEATNVGLGVELELMAIKEALLQLDLLPPTVYMSINASPATAASAALAELLESRPLHRLVLEVTEHDAVTDYEVLIASLKDMRARGLRLAVDDMGSGYANLRHILELHPDVIKLDVALTRGIDLDTPRRALAASFTTFARQIGAKIVAEGMETRSEYETLRELGVHLGQGYYLARPGGLPLPPDLKPVLA